MTRPSDRIICKVCGHIRYNTLGSKQWSVCINGCEKLSHPLDEVEELLTASLELNAKGKWHHETEILVVPEEQGSQLSLGFAKTEDANVGDGVQDDSSDGTGCEGA